MLSDEQIQEIAQRAGNGYVWRRALDPTAPHDFSVGTDMHQMKADIALLIQERRELLEQFEIAARETTMALDALESSWDYSKYAGYGKGVSGWDGPYLLKSFLADLKATHKAG